MTILAIDPGTERSAYVLFDGHVLGHGILPNDELAAMLYNSLDVYSIDVVVFEEVESFGMAVGREVFETVFWTGRLFEIAASYYPRAERMTRRTVKLHLCQSARAKDANIRAVLVDRFGGSTAAKGTKRAPGPLYGITSHEWAALALAVTRFDQAGAQEADEVCMNGHSRYTVGCVSCVLLHEKV